MNLPSLFNWSTTISKYSYLSKSASKNLSVRFHLLNEVDPTILYVIFQTKILLSNCIKLNIFYFAPNFISIFIHLYLLKILLPLQKLIPLSIFQSMLLMSTLSIYSLEHFFPFHLFESTETRQTHLLSRSKSYPYLVVLICKQTLGI